MSIQKRQLINNETGAAFVPIGHTEATYDANGNTVEYRLTHETQDREAADIDLQRDVAELQDTAARVGEGYEPDLSITDESGNAIVEFGDGHIKTKNFDSKDTVKTGESYADFSIADGQGKSIVDFIGGHIKTKKFDSSSAEKKKNIKMLAIGNSFAYDAFQYLPPLLDDMAGVDITLGVLYRASCSVQLHEDFIRNNKVKQGEGTDGYQLYSRYDPQTKRWTTAYIDPPYPSQVIPSEDWDIITLQQHCSYYNVTNPYETNIQPYLPSIIDMLMGGVNNVKMTNNTKFGWLLTPSAADTLANMDASFAAAATCAQNILRDTVFDFVLPCGTGIHNARHTSLDNLGDDGHMTLDGMHLQGGLPMLIESYVAALKILEFAGCGEVGIIGNRIRPTTEWEVNQNLPSRRGTPVGVNDADIMLAQKCAIWAIKNPYEITDNIETSNT